MTFGLLLGVVDSFKGLCRNAAVQLEVKHVPLLGLLELVIELLGLLLASVQYQINLRQKMRM